jgi:DNA primase
VSVFEILRERVSLEELAGRFTELRGSGDKLKGRCPHSDHADTSPSFYVYPDGRFRCYGCGRHGDVVDLWAGVGQLEPGIGAALGLAREYGVELPELDAKARVKVQERREKEDLYFKQAGACHRALSRHPGVVEWWEGRGFDEELRERFLLGANRDGMAAVIPYWHRGRVHGLIRRKLEGEPKYLYPKAEEFADGYRPLFIPGWVRAGAFLVEGIVDALALTALDESAISVGGTGISERQMQDLERVPGPLYILPDSDEDGEQAAREWVRQLYPKALLCPAEYGREAAHA